MDKQLESLIKENNIIVIMRFGSDLYGTNTPDSDTDFKGIHIPSKDDILMQRCPKSINITPKKEGEGIKNNSESVDIEIYSLQYFIELCLKGETVGVDMLHCNKENIVYQNGSGLWDFIQGERSKFYSKNLRILTTYISRQASKYGQKGSRIANAKTILNFLESKDSKRKLGELWENLPSGEHIKFVKGGKENKEEFYQVCGKKMQKTSKVLYCIDQMKNFIDKYGHRALLAEKNKGLDWKALSHATRYALQLKELFETGDIKFPLKDRKFLLEIKQGILNYKDVVSPKLEALIEEVEDLAFKSDFPENSPREYWEDFIRDYYEHIIKTS